jgi:hypothetical protein
VLDYARPDSAARRAQLARMAGWRAPGWEEHFAILEATLDDLAGHPLRPAAPLQPPLPAPADRRQRERTP